MDCRTPRLTPARPTRGRWPATWAVAALASVLLAALAAPPPAAADPGPTLRVALAEDVPVLALGSTSALELRDGRDRLLWRTAGPSRLTVLQGGFFVVLAEPEALSLIGPYASPEAARSVRRELGLLLGRELPLARHRLVVEEDQRVLFADPGLPLRLVAPGGFPTYRGVGYRGAFAVNGGARGLLLVNDVEIEDYLASVIGAEMPASWPREALRAQAVAARTYALMHRARNGDPRYDLCATERCQVYRGLATETATTRQAALDTAGQVLTYGGRLISALYSSNSGGITEVPEHVFGTSVPYLRSVPSPGDADAASFHWTREVAADDLRAALNVERIGPLRDVRVVERSPSGRAVALRLDGAHGSAEVPATEARAALGLRSTLFWPTFQPAATAVVPAGDPAARQDARRAGGRRVALLAVSEPRSLAEARALGAAWLYVAPARVRLEGRGWGHGVGMSQWGARGMALGGADYRAILAHYYPGTAVRPGYGP